ncbi:MAG: type II toxin-antitoxin system VapC family toxin [Caulobacteraceae bacterium]
MIVVDASALLGALLRTPLARAATRWLFDSGETPHAPHLIDVEVAQTLRRHVARGEMDELRRAALADLADFPLRRHAHQIFLPRAWELRHNFTAYDAIYVALAEALDAPLLTLDRRLAATAREHTGVALI